MPRLEDRALHYRHEEAKDRLTFENSTVAFEVTAGSITLAKGQGFLRLREGDYAPVAYISPDHVDMARLVKSATKTICPYKGEASYFSLVGEKGEIFVEDIAWTYENPIEEAMALKGHLAFYPNKAALTEI